MISQGLAGLTNEVLANRWSLVVFMVPAPGYVIKHTEAVIITGEVARN